MLIPAYQPGNALVELVKALAETESIAIVVVDDGSSPQHRPIFDAVADFPAVTLLRHATNGGKGAALKTGFRFILRQDESALGVVTADADGQHDVRDILNVRARFAEKPDSLVLGVRSLGRGIPLRSRIGNQITRSVMRVVSGQDLTDTQTGLRGIPRTLLESMLEVTACGYEFELEMLIAVKHRGIRVIQEPIRTIYEPGNPTSHFQPILDSMRIYFVLLRFAFIALLTAALDNLFFYIIFGFSGSIALAQTGARLSAVLFNYSTVRRAAFHSQEPHKILLPRYLTLVVVNALLSYAGIRLLTSTLPIGVLPAKLLTESLLFALSFTLQRDFVFTRRGPIVPLVIARKA